MWGKMITKYHGRHTTCKTSFCCYSQTREFTMSNWQWWTLSSLRRSRIPGRPLLSLSDSPICICRLYSSSWFDFLIETSWPWRRASFRINSGPHFRNTNHGTRSLDDCSQDSWPEYWSSSRTLISRWESHVKLIANLIQTIWFSCQLLTSRSFKFAISDNSTLFWAKSIWRSNGLAHKIWSQSIKTSK